MTDEQKQKLAELSREMRLSILEETYNAKSGHPGGSLSIVEVLAYLYTCEMKHDPKNPGDPDRDRFVLSKGHTAPALYAVLAEYGYFPKSDLVTLRKIGTHLQGHPDMKRTPGVDMSTGSLGQGLSAACGYACAAKMDGKSFRVYAIAGDGECEEGQIWEAAMFAAHYKLDNLCVVLDLNGLQIDGKITDVMNPMPYDEKFLAFGWEVLTVNGHDYAEIDAAFKKARTVKGKPTLIISKSVKGKGVSFMENAAGWHGKAPNKEQYEAAVNEIRTAFAGRA